jgi:drug/metabolite transporter (DMT)-like permease
VTRSDPTLSTVLLTAVAMIAFAANSVLCRMALAPAAIDPASFTSLRMVSGAATLWLLSTIMGGRKAARGGNWEGAGYLFLYAISFSFAYMSLSAGTGALLLFGSVQITMIAWALVVGERPRPGRWIGMIVALVGFIYLVLPGVTAPSPAGAALMTTAGVAWAFYSLRRRGHGDPLPETAGNFARAAPMALAVSLVLAGDANVSPQGMLLAVTSGALASGLGYVVWYAALRGLTASGAAITQISVAPIATLGGILFLGEMLTSRIMVASILILGGIALALLSRSSAR